jgi:hypothetical protein
LGAAEHGEADRPEHAADAEQAEGRDAVDDGAGDEAQHEHEEGGVDEQFQAVGGAGHDAAGDLADPGVGAEFDVADEGVEGEEHEHQGGGDRAEHLAEGDAGGGRLGFREFLAEEHGAVEDHRDEEERHLDLPVDGRREDLAGGVGAGGHEGGGETTEHEAGGPTGVEDVEVVGLFLREEGGDERIDHGFADAVADGEDEHRGEEAPVGGALSAGGVEGGGGQGEDGGNEVEQEGGDHQLAVADLVGEQARHDDDHAEAGEAAPGDRAKFGHGEPELLGPLTQDAAADGESDAGGENGHEAGPEEPLGVGGDTVFHRCGGGVCGSTEE